MVPYGTWGPEGSNPLDGDMWLNNHIWTPCATWHHSRPFRRQMDDPGRFGYLHTLLSTLRCPDAVSEVDIAISRELK